MAGREEGYFGPSESDMGLGVAVLVAFLALAIAAVSVLCFTSLHGEDSGGAAEGACGLALDVTDERAMHGAGLPTKADVMAWHMYGRWAFYEAVDGTQEVHIWHDLPGGSELWDALYGIDHGNRAFKFV